MKKLSKREKILAIIAGCFALTYLIVFFVIMPAFTALQDSGEERDSLRVEQMAMQRAIAMLPATQQSLEELSARTEEAKQSFYSAPNNTELDVLVTGFCLSHHLKPKSLVIEAVRTPVPTGEPAPAVPAAETPPEGAEGEAIQAALPPPNAVNTVLVTVSLNGEFEDVKAITYDILRTTYARVKSLSYDEYTKTANLVVEVYVQDDYEL